MSTHSNYVRDLQRFRMQVRLPESNGQAGGFMPVR
jgi:hypothetical protein